MKVALVHDHLTQAGGAESVLRVLHEIWPDAPIFTLVYNKNRMGPAYASMDIRTSWLQKIPGATHNCQPFLPFMPRATESYDLSEYDVVLSSSSALAKGVITGDRTLHICYCHTPTRYLWSDTHRYVKELRYPGIIKAFIPPVLTRLRVWDQAAAGRVDEFIANSRAVSERIQKYYRRDSDVIHPPVDLKRFVTDGLSSPKPLSDGGYYLAGGRLVAYKRIDIIVKAFNRLGIPLKIFGSGQHENELKKLARKNVEFLGYVPENDLPALFAGAAAFINPQVEDFGLTPIESMAAGRPVIAYRAGGACETVVQGRTGIFFDEQSWEALADAVVRFKSEEYNSEVITSYAKQFDVPTFQKRIKEFVEDRWSSFYQKQVACL
ncbi:glycosyl transferase [bacterium]|nr:glycosyl transferase [bacterium]